MVIAYRPVLETRPNKAHEPYTPAIDQLYKRFHLLLLGISLLVIKLLILLIPGSPAILGDRVEDGGADDGASDFNYDSENQNQNQKQKISERMLGWQLTYGRSEEVGPPNYDKEVSHNHIPLLTSGQEVIQLASSMIFFSNIFPPFKCPHFPSISGL